MWFLTIINLINSFANNRSYILNNRIDIAGAPISAIDLLIIIGLILVLIRANGGSRFQSDGAPNVLWWILGLFFFASMFGLIGSAVNDTRVRAVLVEFRHLIAMPIAVLIGYHFLFQPRSGSKFAYLFVWSGLACALAQLFNFQSAADSLLSNSNLTELRTVEYVSCYAGVAAALVLYSMLSGVRMFPFFIGAIIVVICVVGAFAPLSRSDWLSTAIAMGVMILILPRRKRGAGIAIGIISVPVLIGMVLLTTFIISRSSSRDVFSGVLKRFEAMLPNSESRGDRAWDTRLPSATIEMNLFLENPLFGKGFAIQNRAEEEIGKTQGFHHIVWTAALAETGIVGFIAMLVVVLVPIKVGARLVKDRFDRPSVLVGACGVAMGVYCLVLSSTTMSINTSRGAIPMGIVCGAVLRCRAMQKTNRRLWEGYLIDDPEGYQLPAQEELVAA